MRIFNSLAGAMGKNISLYRNGNKLATYKGLIQKNNRFDLPHDADVQVNDVLLIDATKEKFTVSTVKPALCLQGEDIDFLEVSCADKQAVKFKPSKTVYNIGTAYGSAFGENATSIYSVSLSNIEQIIQQHGDDPENFKELLSALKEILDTDNCAKGSLSKFGDTLSKHSWLSGPIAQIILNYVTGRAT